MPDFSGKTLLVTGAASGIGLEIARTFHGFGANVMIADLNAEGAAVAAHTIGGGSGGTRAVRYDAGELDGAAGAVEATVTAFGGLDFLVPAAGIYPEAPFLSVTAADLARTVQINLNAVFMMCQAAAARMNEGGAIVTIGSIAGHRGSMAHAPYSATKGAILSLTRSMALELAPRLRVNSVSPGIIRTPMVQDLLQQRGEALLEATPLRRLGEAAEVAAVIAFLCSPAASFVTGETIHVNGGLYMD